MMIETDTNLTAPETRLRLAAFQKGTPACEGGGCCRQKGYKHLLHGCHRSRTGDECKGKTHLAIDNVGCATALTRRRDGRLYQEKPLIAGCGLTEHAWEVDRCARQGNREKGRKPRPGFATEPALIATASEQPVLHGTLPREVARVSAYRAPDYIHARQRRRSPAGGERAGPPAGAYQGSRRLQTTKRRLRTSVNDPYLLTAAPKLRALGRCRVTLQGPPERRT